MSDSFYIVNLDKKQYLSPMAFGDFEGPDGYLKGRHAFATAILTCDQTSDRWPIDSPLAGSWCGSRIAAVFSSWPPDRHCVPTATVDDPGRNLYQMVHEEFEDLSYPCIIMLCGWLDFAAEDMARLAAGDSFVLFHLGNALAQARCAKLERAIVQHVGEDWRTAHEGSRRVFLGE